MVKNYTTRNITDITGVSANHTDQLSPRTLQAIIFKEPTTDNSYKEPTGNSYKEPTDNS